MKKKRAEEKEKNAALGLQKYIHLKTGRLRDTTQPAEPARPAKQTAQPTQPAPPADQASQAGHPDQPPSPHCQPSQPTNPNKATKTRPTKPARQATPTSKPARPATQPAEAASTVSQRSPTAQPASQPEPSQATLTRQAWEACSADSNFYRSKRRCYVLHTNDVLWHENKLFLLSCRNVHGAEARTRFLQAPQAQDHAYWDIRRQEPPRHAPDTLFFTR